MYDVFEITDSGWRGIGQIPESGLKIRTEFNRFDIEYVIPIYDIQTSKEPKECICGEILKGTKLPYDCKLFRKICSPENPIGACMVSSEGTCSAYYKYL
jgi:hydrogenase expression/formation protein HypD